jgi:hypothetical protein
MGGIHPKVKGQTITTAVVTAGASLVMAWLAGGRTALFVAASGAIATVLGAVTGYSVSSPALSGITSALDGGGSITEVPPGL